jgi:hypothetical protein
VDSKYCPEGSFLGVDGKYHPKGHVMFEDGVYRRPNARAIFAVTLVPTSIGSDSAS